MIKIISIMLGLEVEVGVEADPALALLQDCYLRRALLHGHGSDPYKETKRDRELGGRGERFKETEALGPRSFLREHDEVAHRSSMELVTDSRAQEDRHEFFWVILLLLLVASHQCDFRLNIYYS